MSKRHLLLLSNSTLHPTGYLEYAREHITNFLTSHNVKKVKKTSIYLIKLNILIQFEKFAILNFFQVLFVPYALADRDGYEDLAGKAFRSMGFELDSVHRAGTDPRFDH